MEFVQEEITGDSIEYFEGGNSAPEGCSESDTTSVEAGWVNVELSSGSVYANPDTS